MTASAFILPLTLTPALSQRGHFHWTLNSSTNSADSLKGLVRTAHSKPPWASCCMLSQQNAAAPCSSTLGGESGFWGEHEEGVLTQAGGFHSRGGVDCVSKKAIPGHGQPHHSCYHRACLSHTHTHIYIYIHTHIYTHIYIYKDTHISYIHNHAFTHTYIHTHPPTLECYDEGLHLTSLWTQVDKTSE